MTDGRTRWQHIPR